MTTLILHGIGGHAGIHWQQWLHDILCNKGHSVIMPEMPDANRPDRKIWLKTVTELLINVDPVSLSLVGHSLGVATLCDYLETINVPIQRFVSVSGFADSYGAELNSYFMKEKTIDHRKVKVNCNAIHVIYGDNDPYVPQGTLRSFADKLSVIPVIISNGGHVNANAGFTKLPALLPIFGVTEGN